MGRGVEVIAGVTADEVVEAAGAVDAGEGDPPAAVAVEGMDVGVVVGVDFPDPQAADTNATAGKTTRNARTIVFTATCSVPHSLGGCSAPPLSRRRRCSNR